MRRLAAQGTKRVAIAGVALLAIGVIGAIAVTRGTEDPDPERTPTFLADGSEGFEAGSASFQVRDGREVGDYETVGDNTVRISGSDRYATSVAISQEMGWDRHNTRVVYLATGEGYADGLPLPPSVQPDVAYLSPTEDYTDALAAGSSVLPETGPMLLTTPEALPEVVRDELQRLRPCGIIVADGSGAIRRSVLDEADRHTLGCDY